MKRVIIATLFIMLVALAFAQTPTRILSQRLEFVPESPILITDYVTNTANNSTSPYYHFRLYNDALDEERGNHDTSPLIMRIAKGGGMVMAFLNQSKFTAPWPAGSNLRLRIWHIDDEATGNGVEPYPNYQCVEKNITVPSGTNVINLMADAHVLIVPGPMPAVTTYQFAVTSNYAGAQIWKNGADTGETTPHTFEGETDAIAGVYTLNMPNVIWAPESYNYDGAADGSVNFVGSLIPGEAINPNPTDGAEIHIAHDAVATTYDLTWEAPIAGDVDGYKIVWNGGNPIDVGNDLTWTTPAIAEGTYTWMVIPYINDPLPPAPAPGGKTTGFTREFAPLQAKLIAPQTKGDAVNTPTWTFTITRQDPPTLPVELSNFSAVLTAENFVKLSWRTQSETGMLGYRVYRGDSDVQASSMMLPVLIPANNTSNVIDYTWVDSEVEVQHTYWYWLEAVEVNGTGQFYGPLTVRVEGEIPSVLPTITTMGNAYPNPFKQSSSTTIDVSIKEGENGTVTVYNILGQIVKTFKVNEGEHQIHWNGKDARGNNCGSGIYFYKLSTPSTNMTKKMVIVK